MELLLVLCLCISTWTGKTLGDENGLITVTVSQGSDAILPCSPTTKENLSFKSFKWRKDGQNVFYYDAGIHYNNGHDGQDPQFKDRVSFFEDQLRSGNASIQIQNVMIQDSGIYSCEISGLNSGSQTFNIKLLVNVPTLPAREGSHVILPCSPSGKIDLTHQMFDWKKDNTQEVFLYTNGKHYNNGLTGQNENFKNRVEFFQDQLQFGNASIRINKTKLTDSGIYSCTFPLLQPPEQKFYMNLVVRAFAKPSVRTIKETDEGTQLSCEVLGASPKPIIVWHDSAGHNLSAEKNETTDSEGHYNILLKTTVTITGSYTCVATQEELHHQIKITTFVRVRGLITVTVSQGSDAILPCSPTTKEDLSFKSFKWRRNGQNVFYYDAGIHYNNGLGGQDPQFKDRVSFFQDQLRSGNASIQIQNVKFPDSGIYSCEISGFNSGIQTFNIKLVVDVPTLHATEGSDVMLPCSRSGKIDLTHETFDWKKNDTQEVFLYRNGKHYNNGLTGQNENFRNRVEFFQDQLQFGNASIRIKNTKLTDSGNYSCTFPLLQPPGQKFYMKLVVQCINLKDRTQDRSDVCPKPILSTKKTADGITVNCSVPDVSKVEMELHNSDDGTVYKPVEAVTSQNPQDFIFSVTKEGNYRCLVKQKEFCHQLYSEVNFVPSSGDDKGLSPGYVAVAVILFAVVTAAVLYFLWKHKRSSGDRTNDVANSEGELHHLKVQKDSELTNET